MYDEKDYKYQLVWRNKPNKICVYVEKDEREGRYVIAVDPSWGGEGSDWLSVHVYDTERAEEVAQYRDRIEPTEAAQRVAALAQYYNGAFVIVERNGPGEALLNALVKIYSASKIYKEVIDSKSYDEPTEKLGWWSTQRKKEVLIHNLCGAY